MTAITINLLVQEELTQRAQAQDPLKFAVLIGVILVGLTGGVGFMLGQTADRKDREATALAAKWDATQAKTPQSIGVDTKGLQTVANDYLAITQARTLYAPQLALIKDVIPDFMQLTAIRLGMITETLAAPPPPPGISEAKAARAAKPRTVERLDLVLDGTATAARPEIEVDAFIKNLREHPVFSQYVEDVRLRSIARAATGKADTGIGNIPSVTFSIDCLYKAPAKDGK